MRIFHLILFVAGLGIRLCRGFQIKEAISSLQDAESRIDGFFSNSGHTNNWAVLICSSRFWFNYRHIANTLSMYRTVKRLGIPDSNIILMLSDDVACNARNTFPATVYNDASKNVDLYGENIEVDYRGYEVSVENVIRLFTGRQDPATPPSKRLLTDDRSNIFVFMTGHGGDEFLKFQDHEEISSQDIADAFEQMRQKKRYHEIFFMIDTCQANTMYSRFYSANILATGSSMKGQNSYSHHSDSSIGVAVIDSFTYYNLDVLERVTPASATSLQDLFSIYTYDKIRSSPGVRTDLFNRDVGKTLITDFLGGVKSVELVTEGWKLGRDFDLNEFVKDLVFDADSTPDARDTWANIRTANTESEPRVSTLTSPQQTLNLLHKDRSSNVQARGLLWVLGLFAVYFGSSKIMR